ncbi:MAG TPA: hypothetical protein PLI57_04185 [Spirochaetota bacterium]|nr:hypothetical protein [Spirochaetota bacterium]
MINNLLIKNIYSICVNFFLTSYVSILYDNCRAAQKEEDNC